MDDNKNKKINEALPEEKQTNEELPDDALEKVAGGGLGGLVPGAVREGMNPADGDETDAELPDDALENVAGGGFKDWLKDIFK